MITGIPGVSTSDIMEAGGKATFKKYPGIELIGVQPGKLVYSGSQTSDGDLACKTWKRGGRNLVRRCSNVTRNC